MSIQREVDTLFYEHRHTWEREGRLHWFLGLLEEVAELGLSMIGLHKGPPEWELTQIAAIAMNMRRHHYPSPRGIIGNPPLVWPDDDPDGYDKGR